MFAYLLDFSTDPEQEKPRTLTIGITGDEMLKKKKYAEFLETWSERQKTTSAFLQGILDFSPNGRTASEQEINEPGPNGHAVHTRLFQNLVIKCVEIWDAFGPTITEPNLSALVVSAETRSGGQAVNDKRREKGWTELEVFEVDVLDAEESESSTGASDQSFQSKLSSTEIRRIQSDKARTRSKA